VRANVEKEEVNGRRFGRRPRAPPDCRRSSFGVNVTRTGTRAVFDRILVVGYSPLDEDGRQEMARQISVSNGYEEENVEAGNSTTETQAGSARRRRDQA
jgi:hypothetical protein